MALFNTLQSGSIFNIQGPLIWGESEELSFISPLLNTGDLGNSFSYDITIPLSGNIFSGSKHLYLDGDQVILSSDPLETLEVVLEKEEGYYKMFINEVLLRKQLYFKEEGGEIFLREYEDGDKDSFLFQIEGNKDLGFTIQSKSTGNYLSSKNSDLEVVAFNVPDKDHFFFNSDSLYGDSFIIDNLPTSYICDYDKNNFNFKSYNVRERNMEPVKNNFLGNISTHQTSYITPLLNHYNDHNECLQEEFRDYQFISGDRLLYKVSYMDFKITEGSFIYPQEGEDGLDLTAIQDFNNGMIGGSTPDVSDKIIWRKKIEEDNIQLGKYLYTWLNVDTWKDRYQITGGYEDIESELRLWNGMEYEYLPAKVDLNNTGSLLYEVNSWSPIIEWEGEDIIRARGSELKDLPYFDSTIHSYALSKEDKSLYDYPEFTISLDVFKEDWNGKEESAQIIGNFYDNRGFSLSYNNIYSSIGYKIVEDQYQYLYTFNTNNIPIEYVTYHNTLYSTHSLQWTPSGSWVLGKQLNGNYWGALLFSENGDVLKRVSNIAPLSHTILNVSVDKEDNLLILSINNVSAKILWTVKINGDISSTIVSSTARSILKTFNGDLKILARDFPELDSEENIWSCLGKNVYKNENVLYHLSGKIEDLYIGSEDEVYVLYDETKISKIDKNGSIITNTITASKGNRKIHIFSHQGKYRIGIFSGDSGNVYILDQKLSIVGIELLNKGWSLHSNNQIDMEKFSYVVRGDITGFKYIKRYINSINQSLTFKVGLWDRTTEESLNKSISIPIDNMRSGWHHIDIRFSNSLGKMGILLDGEAWTLNFDPNKYVINYDDYAIPYFIGSSSYKNFSLTEYTKTTTGKFNGKIGNLKFFKEYLKEERLNRSFLEGEREVIWHIPLKDRNYYRIENVENVYGWDTPYFKTDKRQVYTEKGILDI